ncbi:sigma-70 family RNA polymerase sigma factor SigK [soil metagenome]
MSHPRLVADHDLAFEDVYREHHEPLVRLARRWLGDDNAQHVAHEVLLAHWQRPTRFDAGRGSLRSFLLMNCRSRAIDACRAEAALRRRDARYSLGAPTQAHDVDSDTRDHVARALDQLPPAQREAIVLAFFGGLTYREVALRLGDPEGTVKARIRAGLSKLRTIIEPTELLAS